MSRFEVWVGYRIATIPVAAVSLVYIPDLT